MSNKTILFPLLVILFVLIYLGFLHPYKANYYAGHLSTGMNRGTVEAMIPYKIYYRTFYRSSGKFIGARVGWVFNDGSRLDTDFDDIYGLKSFDVDKSKTLARAILNFSFGFILLIGIIVFIKRSLKGL